MAYLEHRSWRDRPGAIVGVVAIHALVGYGLITGLKFEKIVETIPGLEGYEVNVPLDPPPPPPSKPDPAVEPDSTLVSPPLHVPVPPVDLNAQRPPVDATSDMVVIPDVLPKVIPGPTPSFTPSATPSPVFDPVAARPRNNPAQWISTDDYRSSWINRELTGTARFRLAIAANGSVEGCTITGSSGHAELDKATCDLVTRRARFDPAKDTAGQRTPGTFASSVRWELPE
ncbi:TonB family protein [Altererythrobacter aerius]|uniref:TonB family protein n=1 Tax=Tsuneonella aeria TaxID=1837929 RepID=A0A6I4TEB7_9SPHN|nr:energy transducer TonB [Tsuneonella aeria]MXO74515.1 TonB family protein [Tsuneonella aeria]